MGIAMYSKITFSDEIRFGVAHLQEPAILGACFPPPGILLLPYFGSVTGWNKLSLSLTDGDFVDYFASDLGCRLCSRRLKALLQAHASAMDVLQWLPVEVTSGIETKEYFILHFPSPPDILDREKTIFAGTAVIKPVLSKQKIAGHKVLTYSEGGNLPLFVSDDVKSAIVEAGFTGLNCVRVPVQ
jgi:hypothetical protein